MRFEGHRLQRSLKKDSTVRSTGVETGLAPSPDAASRVFTDAVLQVYFAMMGASVRGNLQCAVEPEFENATFFQAQIVIAQ